MYRIFDSRIARESWTFIGSTLIAERARVTSRLNRKTEREREREISSAFRGIAFPTIPGERSRATIRYIRRGSFRFSFE